MEKKTAKRIDAIVISDRRLLRQIFRQAIGQVKGSWRMEYSSF
jgi:hypothetical protein